MSCQYLDGQHSGSLVVFRTYLLLQPLPSTLIRPNTFGNSPTGEAFRDTPLELPIIVREMDTLSMQLLEYLRLCLVDTLAAPWKSRVLRSRTSLTTVIIQVFHVDTFVYQHPEDIV